MTIAPLGREATLEDLDDFDGPAELIDGEIIPVTGTNFGSGNAAFRIRLSLYQYGRLRPGSGHAISEGVRFVMHTPRTQAFIPDVAWFVGDVTDAGVVFGAPVFAVEVRSNGDYGPTAEREMARRRSLYFAAGTRIVWDVDVLREGWIRAYHAGDPEQSVVYRRGEVADAEAAVPGWRFEVDELFR